MMREQTSVRFTITSATVTAADLQARTGLVPDETWKVGDPRGHFGNVEKQHGFVLESKAPIQNSLDDHVKAMLKRLAPYAQKIGALGNDVKIVFACVLQRKQAPALRFERDDLRWLGVMGARLDVDVILISDAYSKPPAKPAGAGGEASASGTPSQG